MSQTPTSTDSHDLRRVSMETIQAGGVAHFVFHGEADFSTLEELDSALGQVRLDQGDVVHLNLSGLEFADTAAIRQLARFARQARHNGHDVETTGAGTTLRAAVDQLGVRDDLGLV
jgi:ABC-type transporter Mla MlaB component